MSTTRYDYAVILDAVAEHYRLTLDDLVAHDRRRHVAEPRQLAMLLLHRAGYTMAAIGRMLDRDHTTVSHGVRRAAALARHDSRLRSDAEVIRALVAGETWLAGRAQREGDAE